MDRWQKVEGRFTGKSRVLNRTFHSFTLATKECLNKEGMSDMVLPSSFFFAHKLFSEKTIQALQSSGLVYARHDFAAAWVTDKSVKSDTDPVKIKKRPKK